MAGKKFPDKFHFKPLDVKEAVRICFEELEKPWEGLFLSHIVFMFFSLASGLNARGELKIISEELECSQIPILVRRLYEDISSDLVVATDVTFFIKSVILLNKKMRTTVCYEIWDSYWGIGIKFLCDKFGVSLPEEYYLEWDDNKKCLLPPLAYLCFE